jgi:hypothetical protein
MPIAHSTKAAAPPARMVSIDHPQGHIVAKHLCFKLTSTMQNGKHKTTVKPLASSWKTLQIPNSDISIKLASKHGYYAAASQTAFFT